MVGVTAGGALRHDVLLARVVSVVAGALSMAAGEYVSVSSQADTEIADLATEPTALAADPAAEQRELAAIYVRCGLNPALAQTVARRPIMRLARARDSFPEISALVLKSAP